MHGGNRALLRKGRTAIRAGTDAGQLPQLWRVPRRAASLYTELSCLDMTHAEIRTLLGLMDQPAGDCGGVNQLLDEHIAHVDVRMAELFQLKQQLSELRQRCQSDQAMDACGILQGLASMETEPRHERHTHLG